MPQSVVCRDLEEAAAAWSVTGSYGSNVVLLAVDALVAGEDTPALRDLAGHSVNSLNRDLLNPIERTLESLALRRPEPRSDLAKALALRFQCRRFLDRKLSASDLISRLFEVWEGNPPDSCYGFLVLYYDYELMDENGHFSWNRDDVAPLARGYLQLTDDESIVRAPRTEIDPEPATPGPRQHNYSHFARVAVPAAVLLALAGAVALIVFARIAT